MGIVQVHASNVSLQGQIVELAADARLMENDGSKLASLCEDFFGELVVLAQEPSEKLLAAFDSRLATLADKEKRKMPDHIQKLFPETRSGFHYFLQQGSVCSNCFVLLLNSVSDAPFLHLKKVDLTGPSP